jgi:putative tryptophan/tyrosine transport system substrate-binding protein
MLGEAIKRRTSLSLLGGAAAAWPLAARAQQSGKVYRIGFLGVTSLAEYGDRVEAVRTGLRRLGYEEGKNIVIHYRWANGRYDRLPELAAELVRLNVDVIVTHSTPGSRAAKHATATIPIVANSGDPVEAGLVDSLARPGGNLTGTTFFFAEICAKRVELIKEAIPAMTRLAVLVNPANSSNRIALSAMQRTARAVQVELVPVEVKVRDDIAAATTTVGAEASALVVIEDPVSISNDRWTAELALQNRLPMIGFQPHAKAGALMDYGPGITDQFYRLAAFVDKILKGTRPAELPIERAVKFDLVVNLKSAKRLGIELPASLLIRADEVIE